MRLIVQPEDQEKFTVSLNNWGVLIQTLGWEALCDMYVNRTGIFEGVKELQGINKITQARQEIINMIAWDLKQNGMKVISEDKK